MSPTGNWSYPTSIRFGAGRIGEIADACAAAGMRRPLLVTDRGLAGLPITRATLNLLAAAGLGEALFSDVDPNPNEHNLAAGIEAYNRGGHDGVIAFGGGSGLDLGKVAPEEIAVAVLAEMVALRAGGGMKPGVTVAAPATAVDPVCGMSVDMASSHHRLEHGGTTYHFCAAGCLRSFEASPEDYLAAG